ncbi:squalene/phytoene synthase [Streptomyces noursei ATCC 11455]|uniref:phytoene/squalene synthase family protein n=1 Tax=Streptomyces noursei TaxID=1971 RepID=UPI00081CA939|nr:squalene/phytoene synthase [Streptomyces noursei ATCC 11455]
MLLRRWLDAAGIHDPVLRQCYTVCIRDLHKCDEGRAGWWGLRAAPAALRPHVAAIVTHGYKADAYADTGPVEERKRRLDAYGKASFAAIQSGGSADPILHAMAHTFRAFDLPRSLAEDMLTAMHHEIDMRQPATYEEWRHWATGIAGTPFVVLMLVLRSDRIGPWEPLVRELGELFQLTDVLCDLADDLADRRLYLPADDLDRFGVRAQDLLAGHWTPATAELIAFEADRVRHRLPSLVTTLDGSPASAWADAMGRHCTLLLDLVHAAGADLLHRPVRPPVSALFDVWQHQWRTVIPC